MTRTTAAGTIRDRNDADNYWRVGVLECWSVVPFALLHYPATPLLQSVLGFLKQTDVGDSHPFVDRFAHIINGEERDRDTGERFHLYASLGDGTRGASNFRSAVRDHDVDLNLAQRQSVTEWNEMCSLFRRLNSGQSRRRNYIALGDFVLVD